MKSCRDKTGFTLTEILVVVAIIAILTTMVITLAARFETQGKERGMKSALALLDAALGEFRDYGFSYRHQDYNDLEFPLDCNGFSKTNLETALENALGLDPGDVLITPDYNDPNLSGSEALYFFLSRVPDSRKTLDKIDSSLITDEAAGGVHLEIDVDGRTYPLLRIIDPWGRTIRYDYYDESPPPLTQNQIEDMQDSKKVFPVITSAGQDGEFGTDDDITNR
jgi:prepilin-type N-terminal cleavage/methylation domain-containing protein